MNRKKINRIILLCVALLTVSLLVTYVMIKKDKPNSYVDRAINKLVRSVNHKTQTPGEEIITQADGYKVLLARPQGYSIKVPAAMSSEYSLLSKSSNILSTDTRPD